MVERNRTMFSTCRVVVWRAFSSRLVAGKSTPELHFDLMSAIAEEHRVAWLTMSETAWERVPSGLRACRYDLATYENERRRRSQQHLGRKVHSPRTVWPLGNEHLRTKNTVTPARRRAILRSGVSKSCSVVDMTEIANGSSLSLMAEEISRARKG